VSATAESESKRALITGIAGQDGSFLAELLLEKGYAVVGLVHGTPDGPGPAREATGAPAPATAPAATAPLGCSEHLRGQLELLVGDLLEPDTLKAAVYASNPDEIYHLAAPSFVPASWERPGETVQAIAGSTASILEAVRDLTPAARVFVAASGAIFGDAGAWPQDESTCPRPATPYAIAKLAAHQLVGAMRARDGLHASSGIVFNHESERRPARFVTRRITRAAASISLGLQAELTLGDLGAIRDWSFAGDVVHGAWLMLQQDNAADYVLASGVPHTVADFAKAAFACVGLDHERYVRVDPSLVRSPDSTPSVGDATRARECLGWAPRLDFDGLVARMVAADLHELEGA
jgi:GDPmannose 4,6-dehydratase